MKKINVIDFDYTLVPFDSFRNLLILLIRRLRFSIIFFSFLRLIRIINNAKFKELIIKNLMSKTSHRFINNFVDYLFNNIRQEILTQIEKYTDKNTLNIVCSASPALYINPVASKLGYIGYGSHFDKDGFIHLFKENKLRFIENKYSPNHFEYNFAISDSSNDLILLKKFKNYLLLNQ